MPVLPFTVPRRVALLCACACGLAAADQAAPMTENRFDTDSTVAYAHIGSLGKHADAYADNELLWEWDTAIQAFFQIHVSRLVLRLGGAALYRAAYNNQDRFSGNRTVELGIAVSDASLRLRFGALDADDGIRIGVMPLQGNPDAILFGNYLARYQPYPPHEGRRLEGWDSLGALAPRVAGIRLAYGRSNGPMRVEGWLVRDEEDYSWLAFLSGRAPRKIDWGLGVSGYQAFTPAEKYLATPAQSPVPVGSGGGVFVNDTLPSDTVVVTFPHPAFLLSARASLDFASLFGSQAPAGRYGGVFAEAALVGWQDVAYYYPDRWRRLIWTAGARVPAFGWLDACVAQVEWRRPPGDTYYYYGPGIFYGQGTGSWVPAGDPRSRGPSPWTEALFLAKRMGPHAEAQARASTYRGAASREVELLGRIVFRFR